MKRLMVMCLMLVVLTSCLPEYQIRLNDSVTQTIETDDGLGKELVFPEGWKLHSFSTSDSHGTIRTVFICSRDANVLDDEILYRFCTPVIKDNEQ